MKSSIFSDLNKIIETAVNNSTESEEFLQSKQADSVKKAGLIADKKKKDKGVEEADNESADETPDEKKADKNAKKKSGGEEKVKKITGSPDASHAAGSASPTKPGTRTSKKLADPPEKVLKNPQFLDIQQKINTLRGASSLSKKPISVSVQQYLKTLTVPEKAALLTYLTNLSQIMAPVRDPDEVNEPSEVGLITKFKSTGKSAKKKSGEKEEKKKKSSGNEVVIVGED